MSNKPFVSVRTITYNHESYIRQCIESILMQKTNFSFEYIIAEDCSTDMTRDIVFEYAKKHPDIIKVVTSDYNIGMKANAKRGFEACSGKYIAVCEGDDYWIDPNKLQKQVDFMENNPQCSMCFCATKDIYDDKSQEDKIIRPPMIPSNNIFSDEQIIGTYYRYIRPPSILIKNSIIQNLPDWFHQDAPTGDIPLIFICASQGSIGYIDEVMSVYRKMAKNSWTVMRPTRSIDWHIDFLNRSILFRKTFDSSTNFKYHKAMKHQILAYFLYEVDFLGAYNSLIFLLKNLYKLSLSMVLRILLKILMTLRPKRE